VIIAFDDDGPGVPEEMLPKLFEAFFRADPARKNPSGGSGLGLAIVRNAAEQMNGSVWAERGKLGGLAVMLALPAGDAKGETV
jgi:signal transduction histidine kinase